MKPIYFLFVALSLSFKLPAQTNCYSELRQKGIQLLEQKQFREAIDIFFRARYCPNKPSKDDLDNWIKKTQDRWVKALDDAVNEAYDAQAEAEQLRDQAQLALDRATQEKNRAESAEQEARLLAAKADTLRAYLRGDSTYSAFLKSGKEKFGEGKYQEALYDFAIAQFMNETPEIKGWLINAEAGIEAEQYLLDGELKGAYDIFKRLATIYDDDHKGMRMEHIRATLENFMEALQHEHPDTIQTFSLKCYFIPIELTQLPHLSALNLSGNLFTGIMPEEGWAWFRNMGHLKELDLSENNLIELPRELEWLSQLQKLNLRKNYLTDLRWFDVVYPQLQYLNLSENYLFKMDKSGWDFLKKSPQLRELDLRRNQLSAEVIAYIRSIVSPTCKVLAD